MLLYRCAGSKSVLRPPCRRAEVLDEKRVVMERRIMAVKAAVNQVWGEGREDRVGGIQRLTETYINSS